MRSFLVVTRKPRLLKHGDLWACAGLKVRKWLVWWQREEIVVEYGKTPQEAYALWQTAPNEVA